MEIRRLGPGHVEQVISVSPLFDEPARREWASLFLGRDGHHMLVAYVAEAPVGFVSGVGMTHPDKGTEMFLYELAVDEEPRRRGVGRALAEALGQVTAERGCYGMWVGTEPDNVAAIATYLAAGAEPPEPFFSLTWSFNADREHTATD